MMTNYRKILALWGYGIMEELRRNGITKVIISPGSRSTPLVIAAARHPEIETVIAYDERGAAYYALGYARATGKPAVLISTSGTAVANYYPAVIEASMAHIPMIIISADRPPELIDTGANQTIRQPGMFGDYLRWSVNLPVPDEIIDSTYLLSTIDHGYYRSVYPDPGPVHLNMMFRKPLEPAALSTQDIHSFFPSDWIKESGPYKRHLTGNNSEFSDELVQIADQWKHEYNRPLLLIGELPFKSKQRNQLQTLLKQLQLPFWLDSTTGIGVDSPHHFHSLDLLLSNEHFSDSFTPDLIIQIGKRPTSGRLEKFVKDNQIPVIHLNTSIQRSDPNHRVRTEWHVSVETIFHILQNLSTWNPDESYLSFVQRWNRRGWEQIQHGLTQEKNLTEWHLPGAILPKIPVDAPLFVASSLSIRLLDIFKGSGERVINLGANRGVSGIDGTIAGAIGFAAGGGKSTWVLMGDLAFIHDMNSLHLLKSIRDIQLIFIVINNRGGHIFDLLPVRNEKDVFDPFFVTPHKYEFKAAAEQFQLDYHLIKDLISLNNVLGSVEQASNHTLLEIDIDSSESTRVYNYLISTIRNLL
ncbi:MAG: 2-succinyl-5-enolpyruvyl-6-hydroxy-3-cyclohexene-1-carboxylic-acid synthase [Calditrichia bacterium]